MANGTVAPLNHFYDIPNKFHFQDFLFAFSGAYSAGDGIADTDMQLLFHGPNGPLPKPNGIWFQPLGLAKTAAAQTLSSTGTNVSDGDVVVVGNFTYRFKNTMALAYDVKIGGSSNASLDNLVSAINATAGFGTAYHASTIRNDQVKANARTGTGASGKIEVQALLPGALGTVTDNFGNAIVTTETSAQLSWGAGTLAGGGESGLAVTFDVATKKFRLWRGDVEVATTTATGVNALNSATMNVGDTSYFAASGSALLAGVSFTYTGKTATTLTGCGTHAATTGGEAVVGTSDRHLTVALCRFNFFYGPSTPIGYGL